ncbi:MULTISPECIES: type I phosphomannose isomerase catalytic subunit [unclassified Clostridium]|uniref:type I phosphomannose isomerase catalytic subunit n=1 Tax=unclassified Clostridium TaxID=2614128 RepID=UPI001484C938|nr:MULTISPECIES: type I phosphomannose isomerase catalytic subunit [unclassified Clostridium]
MNRPLKVAASLKAAPWGGQALREKLNKPLPEGEKIGESWELSTLEQCPSRVSEGEFTGMRLGAVLTRFGKKAVGSEAAQKGVELPLLVKFLDAQGKLSVQVHPDEAAARALGGAAKTEAWYVVDCKPDAQLVYGLKPGTGAEDLRRAIERGQVQEVLEWIPVKPGDVLFVPAGLVHALGEGILVYEIQQSSDTVYRVYDWDRKNPDGSSRELHISQALQSVKTGAAPRVGAGGPALQTEGATRTLLAACKAFALEKLEVESALEMETDGTRFYALTLLEGTGKLCFEEGEMDLEVGETVYIPADLGAYTVKGKVNGLLGYVPSLDRLRAAFGPQADQVPGMEV